MTAYVLAVNDGSLEPAVRLDSSDARIVRGTLHVSVDGPDFRTGLAWALEKSPVFREVDSGSGWAHLVTQSRGATGSVVAQIEMKRHPQGAVLEVTIAPAERFIFGPSTAHLQLLGHRLLAALEASFDSGP